MKRKDKELRKMKRSFELLEAQYAAKMAYLLVREMEFERKTRNKALRMAHKRKANYIQ